jgi:hypothetical protein
VLLSAKSISQPDQAASSFPGDLFSRVPFGRAFVRRIVQSFVGCGAGLLCCVAPGMSQSPAPAILPKYDVHTETKAKGVVDEVKPLSVGSKKDLRELIIKSGEDKIHIYVCPQTFEQEMGITFAKGDEIAVTGSKVKQEDSDVILARELVKGTDTLVFRDGKGNPVWDPRTGK